MSATVRPTPGKTYIECGRRFAGNAVGRRIRRDVLNLHRLQLAQSLPRRDRHALTALVRLPGCGEPIRHCVVCLRPWRRASARRTLDRLCEHNPCGVLAFTLILPCLANQRPANREKNSADHQEEQPYPEGEGTLHKLQHMRLTTIRATGRVRPCWPAAARRCGHPPACAGRLHRARSTTNRSGDATKMT